MAFTQINSCSGRIEPAVMPELLTRIFFGLTLYTSTAPPESWLVGNVTWWHTISNHAPINGCVWSVMKNLDQNQLECGTEKIPGTKLNIEVDL